MSLSALVVAALPLPITGFGALPSFANGRWGLAALTSMFCFLLVGFVFSMRHVVARSVFSRSSGFQPNVLSAAPARPTLLALTPP